MGVEVLAGVPPEEGALTETYASRPAGVLAQPNHSRSQHQVDELEQLEQLAGEVCINLRVP